MAYQSIPTITAVAAPQTSSDDPGKEAIDICMSAWNGAYDEQVEIKGSSDWDREEAGKMAYLKAAPALSGYKNICDFVARINYASMTDVISHKDAAHYLANARIALSTIYHQPKPACESDPDSPNQPRKKRRK